MSVSSQELWRCGCVPGAVGSEIRVIVHDDFMFLHIPFPRQHDVSPRIFKHRHQEGEYIALREKVLHCLEQAWPLPLPSAVSLFVIESVALPQCYMASVQPLAPFHVSGLLHDCLSCARTPFDPVCFVYGSAAVVQKPRDETLQLFPPAAYASDLVMPVFFREKILQFLLKPFGIPVCPRKITQ